MNKQQRSGKQYISSKQDSSNKHDSTNKHDRSRKQDFSTNYILDVDPNILYENLQEVLGKSVKSESDKVLTKMTLAEVVRVKAITEKQYKVLCKKYVLIIKVEISYRNNKSVLCVKQNFLWWL